MAGRDVEIAIKARDEASAKVAALEASLRRFYQSAEQGGKSLDSALSMANAAAGLQAAGSAARVLTGYLESSGTHAERLQDALTNASGAIGDMSRLGGAIGRKIFGPTNEDMMGELARLDAENRRKLQQLARQEASQAKEKEARLRAEFDLAMSIKRELAEMDRQAHEAEVARWDARDSAWAQLIAESDRAYREEFERAQMLADLDSEIREKQLLAIGKQEQAEIESINRRYAQQIAAAEDAYDEEVADRLQTLRDLELKAVGKDSKPKSAMDTGGVGAFESRTATYVTGHQQDPSLQVQKQNLQTAQAILRMAGEQTRALQQIVTKLPQFV